MLNEKELIRFENLIHKQQNGCWLWKGTKVYGYGVFGLKRNGVWSNKRAHRVSYQHFIKDPGTLYVCHKCDNPSCVNPNHLFLGTQKDNLQDASKKGRIYKGGAKTPWNKNITHCKRGHELSGENLSSYAKRRVCKACQKLSRDKKQGEQT